MCVEDKRKGRPINMLTQEEILIPIFTVTTPKSTVLDCDGRRQRRCESERDIGQQSQTGPHLVDRAFWSLRR